MTVALLLSVRAAGWLLVWTVALMAALALFLVGAVFWAVVVALDLRVGPDGD